VVVPRWPPVSCRCFGPLHHSRRPRRGLVCVAVAAAQASIYAKYLVSCRRSKTNKQKLTPTSTLQEILLLPYE
jgi:hypothetical protein